tara:strand:- start:434 stop:589 length:156 start_codon:yes stop_codon:yes gene_type:complete
LEIYTIRHYDQPVWFGACPSRACIALKPSKDQAFGAIGIAILTGLERNAVG